MEDVAGVGFGGDVGQVGAHAVGEDGLRAAFEFGEVVDHFRAEECGTVVERGFVDDNGRTFSLDALHHTLDRRLAEIVGIGLHGQSVDADDARLLRGAPECICRGVIVISRHAEHLIGYEVLAGAVALDDGGHHVLRHIGIVGQQLFGVLGQAIATIAERWIVIVRADSRIKTDALDYGTGIKTLYFGIRVKLVEVAHTQCQVGIGKELYGLSFLQPHEQGIDIRL